MSNHQPGEVVLLSFPFSDGTGSKRRPALVILDTGDEDIIVARITSRIAQTPLLNGYLTARRSKPCRYQLN